MVFSAANYVHTSHQLTHITLLVFVILRGVFIYSFLSHSSHFPSVRLSCHGKADRWRGTDREAGNREHEKSCDLMWTLIHSGREYGEKRKTSLSAIFDVNTDIRRRGGWRSKKLKKTARCILFSEILFGQNARSSLMPLWSCRNIVLFTSAALFFLYNFSTSRAFQHHNSVNIAPRGATHSSPRSLQ